MKRWILHPFLFAMHGRGWCPDTILNECFSMDWKLYTKIKMLVGRVTGISTKYSLY